MSPSPDPEGWIEKYGDALYRHALAILGQEAEAEDCVQETFSAALEGLSGFSGAHYRVDFYICLFAEWLFDVSVWD